MAAQRSGALTLVLIAFFVIEGIVLDHVAVEHRNQLTGQWGWMLISGIIDVILAVIIFSGFRNGFVGSRPACRHQHLFGGAALIAMALAAGTRLRRKALANPFRCEGQALKGVKPSPALSWPASYSAGGMQHAHLSTLGQSMRLRAPRPKRESDQRARAQDQREAPRGYKTAIIDTAAPENMKVRK